MTEGHELEASLLAEIGRRTKEISETQHELARQQMKGACGLVTVVVKAVSRGQIVTFCESLRHILMAVSWGGYESLAIPRCASLPPGDFDAVNREHRMIRFYFGLEEAGEPR